MRRVWQYIAGTPMPAIPRAAVFGARNITWVSLVPDPVKLVVWTFRRARTGRDVAVRVPVVGNVAVLRASASVAPSAPSVRWYGAHAQRLAAAREPVLADLARWPASVELTGNSVLGVRLGTFYRTAIDQLDHKLHTAPSRPYTKVRGACDADHTAAWGVLTAYFWHGSFIGYQYGRFGGPQTPVLRGPRGLAVGETIAAAEEQFGHAFASGTEQGGSWSVHTASAGLLMGLASRPHGGTIATIAAGSVGCPAVAP